MPLRSCLLFALAVFLLPGRSFASGYPVFDAIGFSQLIAIYDQYAKQIQQVGQILGVQREQLATLEQTRRSIGQLRTAAGNWRNLSINRLLEAIDSIPGVDATALRSLYKQTGPLSGALDLFLGTPLNQFREGRLPWDRLQQWAVDETVREIGGELGLRKPEMAFARWVGGLSPEQMTRQRSRILQRGLDLALARFARESEARRARLQAEANQSALAERRALDESDDLARQAASTNELTAASNRIALVAAQQANEAGEKLVTTGQAQVELLRTEEARRAAEERMRTLRRREP